ncbi:flagellar biosynthesis protein FlhA [Pseudoxanthomonas sp. PXM02]|uniref:flagellar biosynthesis protein FlhA n=1 Tax=Pseudoxanthomonas sp. PXM02 TaxID=2769294 RepID=UPI00177DE5E5|nr:flagellar biosynthesis protein FlhA [Pseudoxanthomonas sp. PXM02]MBD9477431.1 FHIPEP family type III secretion protein [Pseudoxanthomonas sp. PXM02]
MKALFALLWSDKRDLALVALVVGILIILFVPVPPPVLDFLLVINISLALLVLLVTFFTESPLNFSTFPTLLLIATMFRLALNVSATRLILDGADAGRVINAVGSFVIRGNYVVGIVVFLILVVVQYVVVTNGAQRVAEVAARFTLDSMPGKQMSIDADMNMGLIDEHEARRRRAMIEKEANFYGAMDGATKFVKGDAIAGIIIILINIVGGLAIGIAQMGMPWTEAVQRFTLLTVGDGIVTQIPSLVIAVATGIIITRAAADARLGEEIPKQMLSSPRALLVVAAVLLVILFLPDFPRFPVLLVLAGIVALAWYAMRAVKSPGEGDDAANSAEAGTGAGNAQDELQQAMRLEPIEIRMGTAVHDLLMGATGDLADRIVHLRKQVAGDLGFVLPKVQTSLRPDLEAHTYEVLVQGNRVGQGSLRPQQVLAINPGSVRQKLEGLETRDPAYGLPALWIEPEQRTAARTAGYTLVEPDTVLITHLNELVKQQAPELLTRMETERLVRRVRESSGPLVDELVPNILTFSDIQKTLQLLLREQVSIRNIEAILEVLVDTGRAVKSPEDLAERVRERLGSSICQKFSDARGELNVLTLAPEVERSLLGAQRTAEGRAPLFSDMGQLDAFIKHLSRQAEAMMGRNLMPVLLCPSPLRRPLRGLVQRSLPHVAIVGLNEVPSTTMVRSFAAVGVAP